MKNQTRILLAAVTACSIVAVNTSHAAVWTYTGAVSNQLTDSGNWLEDGVNTANAPATNNNQPQTPSINDTLIFDDTIWSTAPSSLFSNSNTRPWGSIVLNNGTLNFQGDQNSFRNRSWSGTNTVVVGDGDADAAQFNLRLTLLNAATSTTGGSPSTNNTKTYVVNSDGTLLNGQAERNRLGAVTWSSSAALDTVMILNGGASVINVELNEDGLTDDADDFVSFNELGSTFTFVQGDEEGQFNDLSDVTDAIAGGSFRLGGSLNSGNAQLQVTTISLETDPSPSTFKDAWQITAVVPEPGSLALLGLGGLMIGARRRLS